MQNVTCLVPHSDFVIVQHDLIMLEHEVDCAAPFLPSIIYTSVPDVQGHFQLGYYSPVKIL